MFGHEFYIVAFCAGVITMRDSSTGAKGKIGWDCLSHPALEARSRAAADVSASPHFLKLKELGA
jgi:hypothetical protein